MSPPPQTLFTYPDNWRAFKAQIAAQYSGARLKVANTAPAFTFGQTNRTPAFLNNFPLGKVGVMDLQPEGGRLQLLLVIPGNVRPCHCL